MSQENVERLRVAHDAFLAGQSEFGGELLDPDIEWDASDSRCWTTVGSTAA